MNPLAASHPFSRHVSRAARWLGAQLGLAAIAIALLCASNSANALCLLSCGCGVTTTNVQFGTYNPLSASNVDSTGTVKVNCNGVVNLLIPYAVSIGTGSSNSFTARTMLSGSNKLYYNLYTTNAYSQVVGDGTGGTGTVQGGIFLDLLGLSPGETWTIYGRIPGGQNLVAPGSYLDAIVVTLTFN